MGANICYVFDVISYVPELSASVKVNSFCTVYFNGQELMCYCMLKSIPDKQMSEVLPVSENLSCGEKSFSYLLSCHSSECVFIDVTLMTVNAWPLL